MVLIDADMIVTRPLAELIDRPRGSGAWSPSPTTSTASSPEWGELLELGTARPRALRLLGPSWRWTARWAISVLNLMQDRGERVDFERTFWRANDAAGYPFLYADQDVLNAILATRVEPRSVRTLDARLDRR